MCGYSTDGNQTPGCSPSNDQHNVYFGSKLIEANIGLVVTDRLGNVRANSTYGWKLMSYFPYGEERTSTPDGVDKFGTYFRDGPGQDYAEQRYYNNGTGRFWSVDPGGMATADASTPTSLNRYAYVNGDPVNYGDPSGRIVVYAGGGLILNCGDDATSIFDGSCTGTDGGWGGGLPCGFGYGSVCGIARILPIGCVGNQFLNSLNPTCSTGGGEGGVYPVRVVFVDATRDCYTINLAGKDVIERDIDYQAYLGDPSQPLRDSTKLTGDGQTIIAETLMQGPGQTGRIPTAQPGKPGQVFEDTISVGTTGDFQLTQTFNVTYLGTLYSGVSIVSNGQISSSNTIVATKQKVLVNGTVPGGPCQ
jgi:RHS repeat-associated protein